MRSRWGGVGAFCGDVPIQIMPIKIIVLTEYNPSGSRPNFFGRQYLTFDKGRAWMPEVERPEFRKDAKPTERSYGKSVGGFRGIVRFWNGWCRANYGRANALKF